MPRQSRTGRRPGNQDTRGAILTAARSAFAARGFGGASLRGIATDAGVDASLIHHYFDTKKDLFLATVDLPIDPSELVAELVADGVDGLGERLVATMLAVWESERGPAMVAGLRTALTEPSLTRPMAEFLTFEVIGRVLDAIHVPGPEGERRTALVASQVAGLLIGRYLLELPALTRQTPEDLVAAIGPTLQRYLEGDFARAADAQERIEG